MHTDVSSGFSVTLSSLEKTWLLKDRLFIDFIWMSYSQLDWQSFVRGSLLEGESKGKKFFRSQKRWAGSQLVGESEKIT